MFICVHRVHRFPISPCALSSLSQQSSTKREVESAACAEKDNTCAASATAPGALVCHVCKAHLQEGDLDEGMSFASSQAVMNNVDEAVEGPVGASAPQTPTNPEESNSEVQNVDRSETEENAATLSSDVSRQTSEDESDLEVEIAATSVVDPVATSTSADAEKSVERVHCGALQQCAPSQNCFLFSSSRRKMHFYTSHCRSAFCLHEHKHDISIICLCMCIAASYTRCLLYTSPSPRD